MQRQEGQKGEREVIDLNAPIENKQRKFGAALEYYEALVLCLDGTTMRALFTLDEIRDGMRRASENKEDR